MSESNMQMCPVVSVTVRPRNGEAAERLQTALAEIEGQDPTAEIRADSANAQFVVAGTSESHLESVCDRVEGDYAISIDVSEPKVLYLETIRKAAEGEGKYIRQTGGAGNYGHCKLRVEPGDPGKPYEFVNKLKGGAVPEKFIRSIDEGARGALASGILAGYPLVDVKVTLFDGSYHEVDSNEMAFKFAGSIAVKEAAREASPALLEPVMAIQSAATENMAGAVIRDINARRGRIEEIEGQGLQIIHAIVPLSELLSTSTHGRPDYEMRFAGYEAVSAHGDDDESGVTANSPRLPDLGRGSAAADLDFE